MEHRFTGPSYTVGIEEELMIVDRSSLDLVNAIHAILEGAGDQEDVPGHVQPELLQCVLEIATPPTANASFR